MRRDTLILSASNFDNWFAFCGVWSEGDHSCLCIIMHLQKSTFSLEYLNPNFNDASLVLKSLIKPISSSFVFVHTNMVSSVNRKPGDVLTASSGYMKLGSNIP